VGGGDSRRVRWWVQDLEMAAPEETSASRYVKLVKEQEAPVEDIRPGELNQPVHVPQLVVHKCAECGQPLPDSYEPPSNEPWTTGILGCGEDMDSCWRGFFCPCVLFGHNVERMKDDVQWTTPCVCHAIFVEGGIALGCVTLALHGLNPKAVFLIGEGLVFAWWMCGIYTGLFRQELQRKYHLQNKPCDPCMVHCCLHWCALCQEHREMQGRLSDNLVTPMTVINPPEPQEMGSRDTATVEHKEHAEIQLSEID
jgi:Cys-rich protein (TIGR01571 family)